jgi:hypothetical protein
VVIKTGGLSRFSKTRSPDGRAKGLPEPSASHMFDGRERPNIGLDCAPEEEFLIEGLLVSQVDSHH